MFDSLAKFVHADIVHTEHSLVVLSLFSLLLIQHSTWVHSLRQVSQHKVTNILQSHFLDVLRLPLGEGLQSPIPELLQPLLQLIDNTQFLSCIKRILLDGILSHLFKYCFTLVTCQTSKSLITKFLLAQMAIVRVAL